MYDLKAHPGHPSRRPHDDQLRSTRNFASFARISFRSLTPPLFSVIHLAIADEVATSPPTHSAKASVSGISNIKFYLFAKDEALGALAEVYRSGLAIGSHVEEIANFRIWSEYAER